MTSTQLFLKKTLGMVGHSHTRVLSPPTKPVTYHSTRSDAPSTHLSFKQTVLQGLCPDKGLYVPSYIPTISPVDLERLRSLTYPQLAAEINAQFSNADRASFSESEISWSDICTITAGASLNFSEPSSCVPLTTVNGHQVLELFHGPTLAFKDVALQTLGLVFEHFLKENRELNEKDQGRRQESMTVLAATSGDTGSAAMSGLKGKEGVSCFVMFPTGRVSKIQEKQMTSLASASSNIHILSVNNSTFDDCQDIVKAAFQDEAFRSEMNLGAVNSINWCRVLAQITYYFWGYFRATDSPNKLSKVS